MTEQKTGLRSEQLNQKDNSRLATEQLGLPYQLPLLRQSTVETYLQCPRKFMFAHRFGLVPKNLDRSRALDIGTMFHGFMEDYFLGNTEECSVSRLGAWIDEKVTSIVEKELAGKWFGKSSFVVQQDLESQLIIARAMFNIYRRTYPLHPELYETVNVEKLVRLDVPGIPGTLSGTIDLLLRNKKTKELWLIDHKTTSLSPLARAKTISFEIQPQVYRILVNGLMEELPVGIVHNIIRVPAFKMSSLDRDFIMRPLKSGPNKGELVKEYQGAPKFENFLKRVEDWYNATGTYADLRDEWMVDPPLLQSWTRFDGPAISEELHTVLSEAGHAAHAEPRLSRFYRVSKSCYLYNRPCQFLSLCRSSVSQWKSKVRDEYEVETVRGDE